MIASLKDELMRYITVITSCRNRERDVVNCVNSIKKLSSLKEHIVIDFSSNLPLQINPNERLKVIRVRDEKEWSITRSYNVGIYFCKTDYILKLDADTELNIENFLKINYKDYDIVYFQKNENDLGNFIAKKKVLTSVNGFNEYITNRFDDHDLHDRIKDANKNILIKDGLIHKKNHSDEDRVSTKKNAFKNFSPEKYSYAVVKATNDAGAYVSSCSLWDNSCNKSYKINKDNSVTINHKSYHKNINFFKKIN